MSNIVCVGDGGLEVQTEIGVVRGVHFRRRAGKRVGFVAGGGTGAGVSLVAPGPAPGEPDDTIAGAAPPANGKGRARPLGGYWGPLGVVAGVAVGVGGWWGDGPGVGVGAGRAGSWCTAVCAARCQGSAAVVCGVSRHAGSGACFGVGSTEYGVGVGG